MKLTISKKLFIGFFAVLLILAATIVISYSQITTVDHSYSDLIDDKAKKLTMMQNLNIVSKKEQVGLRGYLVVGDEGALQSYTDAHDEYLQLSDDLREIINDTKSKEYLKELDEIENEYYQFAKQAIQLKQENKTAEYTQLISMQGREIVTRFDQKADELTSYRQTILDESNKLNTAKVITVKNWVLILGVFSV